MLLIPSRVCTHTSHSHTHTRPPLRVGLRLDALLLREDVVVGLLRRLLQHLRGVNGLLFAESCDDMRRNVGEQQYVK